jgi:cytochrome c553
MHTIGRHRIVEKSRGLGRSLVFLAGTLVLGFSATVACADEPDAVTKIYAQRLAIGVCGTCHGAQGNSTQPKFPRLAGQNANYLAAQLKAFRAQTRGDSDAIGYMWGMAGQLSDETIDALAQYYSTRSPGSGSSSDAAAVAHGREIFEKGIPTEGVPPCSGCHGPDAHGIADFPRLAGQHRQYILKQLGSFQSNMRNVAIMHGVALNLRVPEMQAVAAYLEAQP